MLSENLSISVDEVNVDYVFRNQTEADVEAIVAFPMPDIAGSVYDRPSICRTRSPTISSVSR